MSMYHILIPLVALAINMAVQIALFRHWRGARYFASIASGFLAGALALGVLEGVQIWENRSSEQFVLAFLVNGPVYVALAYCYYSFVQLGQTSIRIRLYSEVEARPDGLSVEDVAREYSDDALMEVRLQRLTESRDIVQKNDRYFVGRFRLVLVGKILFAAKWILLGKGSEFE